MKGGGRQEEYRLGAVLGLLQGTKKQNQPKKTQEVSDKWRAEFFYTVFVL